MKNQRGGGAPWTFYGPQHYVNITQGELLAIDRAQFFQGGLRSEMGMSDFSGSKNMACLGQKALDVQNRNIQSPEDQAFYNAVYAYSEALNLKYWAYSSPRLNEIISERGYTDSYFDFDQEAAYFAQLKSTILEDSLLSGTGLNAESVASRRWMNIWTGAFYTDSQIKQAIAEISNSGLVDPIKRSLPYFQKRAGLKSFSYPEAIDALCIKD